MENPVIKAITESKMEESTSTALRNAFLPFAEQAMEWAEKASKLVVTDATQVSKMKEAREGRLLMKKIRTEADKTRKALKEDSLKYGKAVQAAYNAIEGIIVPIEDHLEKQEKFAELIEIKRQNELREKRQTIIDEYQVFLPQFGDLGKMSEEEFEKLLNIAKVQKEQQENEAKEKARIEEENRRLFQIENEKLKAQQEIERQKNIELQTKLDEERRARAKIEAEQKRQAEEEARRQRAFAIAKRAEEELAQKAAAAPDFEKLKAFADDLDGFEFPGMSTQDGKFISSEVIRQLRNISKFIREQTK